MPMPQETEVGISAPNRSAITSDAPSAPDFVFTIAFVKIWVSPYLPVDSNAMRPEQENPLFNR